MRRTFAILFVTALAAAATSDGQFPPASTSTNAMTTNVPTAFTPQINVPHTATPTVTIPQAAVMPLPASTTALPPTSDGAPRTTPGTPHIVVPPQVTTPTADNLLSRQLTIHRPSPAPPPPLGNTPSLALEQPTIITNTDGTVTMPLAEGLTNSPRVSPHIWDKTNTPAPSQPYHW